MSSPTRQISVLLAPASGPGVGGGHVMRCLTLAEALEARDCRCSFAVAEAGADLIARFRPDRYAVHTLSGPSSIASAVTRARPDGLVIDNYSIDASVEMSLRGHVKRLMVIDDLANRSHAADLVLDPGYGRTPDAYRKLAPRAIALTGPEYALVRNEFRVLRSEAGPTIRPAIDRIFVSFGLADIGEIARRAVELLLRLAPAARLEVALASDAPSAKALSVMAARDVRVRVHLDARDVAGLMADCDLCVGAGGSGVWERAVMGLPSLIVVVADNQRELVRRLANEHACAAADMADASFDASFADAFRVISDPAVRREMAKTSMRLCDGRGADRAADELIWLLRR